VVDDAEAKNWAPTCVLVDEKNKIKKVSA
jgi:aspartate 1-decarboxylase